MAIRKRFLTQRVVGHWNRFPGAVVTTPNPTEMREFLDTALIRHRVGLLGLCRARSWTG